MKEAVIAFVRAAVAAGVATAIKFITDQDLANATAEKLAVGLAIAFISGVIAFAGQYLREKTPETNIAKATSVKRASKLDWLPF